jgi:pyruvate oxidase/acetolactate synthase-1/2/3 large subunit
MAKYRCTVCNYVYDEVKEGKKFGDLPKEWVCPVCGAPQSAFVLLTEKTEETAARKGRTVSEVLVDQLAEWGVGYVFGVPGTSTLGVVDAVRKDRKSTRLNSSH